MKLRLGQVLVDAGTLTEKQVEQVLERQKREQRPFGLLCEEMFGLEPDVIENAWAKQYASITQTIDPSTETYEEAALELVTRRQAWQFRLLPVRFDGSEVMIVTTTMYLRRALRFASRVLNVPVYFVITDSEALGESLCKHYPLPGMTAASVNDAAMDRLLGSMTGGGPA